jgi:hypothetical protein
MSSKKPGTDTSPSEVTSIGPLGFWLLVEDEEFFVPFREYPVFRSAPVEQIFDVQRLSPTQFHWPSLDADIELEALRAPEKYPLTWK